MLVSSLGRYTCERRCASAVVLPAAIAAPLSSVMVGAAGVDGVLVSTLMVHAFDSALSLWPLANCVAVMVCEPSVSAPVNFSDHLPDESTVVEPQRALF